MLRKVSMKLLPGITDDCDVRIKDMAGSQHLLTTPSSERQTFFLKFTQLLIRHFQDQPNGVSKNTKKTDKKIT